MLPQLESLNLGYNRLATLPRPICELKTLQTLNLQNNQLTSLPEGIRHLVALETLSLHNNQLTSLPAGMANLSSLSEMAVDAILLDEARLGADQTTIDFLTQFRQKNTLHVA